MRVQASALAFFALAASTSAFSPSSGLARNQALKGSMVEQFELPNIEDEVSFIFRIVDDTWSARSVVCYWYHVVLVVVVVVLEVVSQTCAMEVIIFFPSLMHSVWLFLPPPQIKYKPGKANTDFARRFGGLVGKDVKTVSEAFTQFTDEYGYTVNALYKGMVTDIVQSTHLIMVNARFQRDPVWSLGILTSLDLLLKNYPEPGMKDKITSALFKSVGLDEKAVRADAKMIEEWAQGKTKDDIEASLAAANSSDPLGAVAAKVKSDEFWMYSRYFGIGLVKLMDIAGVEMDKDEVYPVMEKWMSKQLGKSHLTACVSIVSILVFEVFESTLNNEILWYPSRV